MFFVEVLGEFFIQFAGSCETSSPLLLFVWVARSSIPKMIERFSSLSSIIGHLVEKKRDENANFMDASEHVILFKHGRA